MTLYYDRIQQFKKDNLHLLKEVFFSSQIMPFGTNGKNFSFNQNNKFESDFGARGLDLLESF